MSSFILSILIFESCMDLLYQDPYLLIYNENNYTIYFFFQLFDALKGINIVGCAQLFDIIKHMLYYIK
jgi:hypothetical protein